MARPTSEYLLSRLTQRGDSTAIKSILAVAAQPGMLSMAGGLPAPESFPAEMLRAAMDSVMSRRPSEVLQYAPTEGVSEMRDLVAGLATQTGAPCTRERALVTSGSQQGLDLITRTLVDPGDTVALEDPSYLGAVQTFQQADARLLAVPGDSEGLDTEVLEALLRDGHRPKLVYVVPHFHNPTGAVLSPQRRRHLAELSETYGFVIVEDDPYAELWFDEPRQPSIDVYTDRVVRLMSLSKTMCPGLRVAGMVGPAPVLMAASNVKQCTDLQSNTLGQHLVAETFSDAGFLTGHLTRLRSLYRAKANELESLLFSRIPQLIFGKPRGGLFLWCRLAAELALDARAFAAAAVERGVAVVPGDPFCIRVDGSRYVRLSYATLSSPQLDEATARLAAVCRDALPIRGRGTAKINFRGGDL
ncbi:PLP-dependent aminotransferase family protein [Micromonospora maritima]|uniref:PLP-dependent aminotransferase family protein n=1 Tax=Micromonospora maritima TaxID=986711 RepID=A0ABW7ZT66_9ACTN